MAQAPSSAASSAQSSNGAGTRKARRAILGRKVGMTQMYSEDGRWLPVTVLQVGPLTVLQVKTVEKDGYTAVQVGLDETKKKKNRPQQAYLDKNSLKAHKHVRELPFVEASALLGDPEKGIVPGAQFGVGLFKEIKRVDVRGVTKGRGFQGVIRRWRFNAGPKSRGTKNIREPKSTGMHTDPGRVHKGWPMPGHMGAVLRKARNLDIVRVEEAENLLVVRGSVPGPNGGYVYIQESLTQPREKSEKSEKK